MTVRSRPGLFTVAFTAAAICAVFVSAAYGSFGISSFEATYSEAPLAGAEAEALGPLDLQAGSHPFQFTAKVAFAKTTNAKGETVIDGSAKGVQIKLPPGVTGNLTGIPPCPQAIFMSYVFGGTKCPADTQVGVVTVNGGEHPLFNLVPPAGLVGQIGAAVLIAPFLVDLSIRSSDYGLTAEIHNLSQIQEPEGVSIVLWGVPADPRHDHLRCLGREGSPESCPSGAPLEPLLTMPTACAEPLTTRLTAQSWEAPDISVEKAATVPGADGNPATLEGCERLRFDPTVTVRPESTVADTPTGLSIDMRIPFLGGAEELAEASLEKLVVALPTGLSINPATAGGLIGCTPTEIALGQASEPTCPDASKLGTFEIQTPILPKALEGLVYMAQPPSGLFDGQVAIYLAGEQAGLDFKLAGQLSAQPESGQLTLTLDNVPELPLSDLNVNLFGGPRGALATSAICGALTANATLTPYSTTQATMRSSGFAIDQGCGGAFTPSFKAGATSAAAGQGTSFALHVGRSDGQQYIQDLSAVLPPGVMANIGSVPQCSDAAASAGTCPAGSDIGAVTAAVGAGSDPFYLHGRAYLTGPYKGNPFGISLVIPALTGPFDLGTVIVRGGISVDLSTSSLSIATDALPTILRGIPLRLKSLDLAIDRPGFMVNPTNCSGRATSGTVDSSAGLQAAVSAPFRALGCAGLAFAPKLAAATLGKASSRGNGASLNVKVSNPAGTQANLQSLVIKLPGALRPRLSAVQQACLAATFVVNPQACPAFSVVGRAAVVSPMLSVPLTGPVYLVFHRGAKYPDLVMLLRGGGLDLRLKGAVGIEKGLSTTTFSGLPDIPISLLELDLPEGSHSLLGATKRLCARRPSMLATTVGQNGARRAGDVRVSVGGCHARAVRATRRHRTRRSAARTPTRTKDGRSR